MKVSSLKYGEFFRYKLGNNVMTLRREKDCYILLEPESFTVFKLNVTQARILQLLLDASSIDEICEDLGVENNDVLRLKVESFKQKCKNSKIL